MFVLSRSLLGLHIFPTIWEKTDKPEDIINGQIQIALGSGERQSKRLREKKDSDEESRKTITSKTTKTSVVRKPGVKKKYDVQKSEDTLKKITEQKVTFVVLGFSC